MKKWILFCFLFCSNLQANQLFVVENKTVDNKPLQYTGVLVPGDLVEITSPYNATVKAKYVSFGEKVTQDQVLYELSSPELQARLTEEKMRLFEYTQNLEKIEHWQSSTEMLQAQYNVNRAEDELEHDQDRYEQTQKLYNAGIVSKEEYASDERSYKQSLNHFNQTKKHLEDIKKKGDKQYVELAKMKVWQSNNQIKILNQKVEELTIRSPLTGIFLPPPRVEPNREWSNGFNRKTFHEDQCLGIVAENDNVYVQIKVDEYDIVSIHKNQDAKVRLLAFGDKQLKGKIYEINMLTNKASQSNAVANFDVKIKLDEVSPSLKEKMLLGMTAEVKLTQPTLQGLFVPKQAIVYQNEEPFINIFVDEKNQSLQKVELGPTANNDVLVIKGLKQGDKVVVAS
ncbi:MAG: efflux RND transporter periplasmic adaptor subunit [Proteobacteria bacterium]|nr:efflux RND transporter periplasmic adaptor subunit [Pseudomonadota bacterium]